MTAYMKDMVTLLLENRPDKPINFITDYFRNVLAGSNPLTRAIRFIRLSPAGHPAFEDNLVSAYAALDGRRGHIAAGDLHKLLRLLCSEAPLNIARPILTILDKRDTDTISFTEFACSVRATIELDETLCRAEALLAVVTGAVGSPGPSSAPAAVSRAAVAARVGRDTGGGAASSEHASGSGDATGVPGCTTDLAYIPPPLAPRSLLELILRHLKHARSGSPVPNAPSSPISHAAACSALLHREVHASLVAPMTSRAGAAFPGGLSAPGHPGAEMIPVKEFYFAILRAALDCDELGGAEAVMEAAISAATLRERPGDVEVPLAAKALASKLAAPKIASSAWRAAWQHGVHL